MVSYTANLKLRVPVFDQDPWDDDINGDLYVLDAAVGKFFGVANMAGVWKNNTPYVVGQAVIDAADGSIWTAILAHTTPAAPTTFAMDRVANPGRWTVTASTAQEYAAAAAGSATSAASSATAAAGSAADAANSAVATHGALPLSGGTMTGQIILAGDPINTLGAASKQYVDARVGGTGFLPTSGGTMTGPITLSGDPTSGLHAATRQYVDTFMPRSGGTFTGPVSVNGTLTSTGAIQGISLNLYNVGAWLAGDGNYTYLNWDSSNWRLFYTRASGNLQYQRGYDGAILMTIDYSGNFTVPGTLRSNNGRVISYSGANPSLCAYNSAGYAAGLWSDSSGNLGFGWLDGSGLPVETRFHITRAGSNNFSGTMAVDGGITSWNGTINANNGLVIGNTVQSRANVHMGIGSGISDFYLGPGGAGRILNFASSWFLEWNASTGTLAWIAPGGARWYSQSDATFGVYGNIICGGTGVQYSSVGGETFSFRYQAPYAAIRINGGTEIVLGQVSDERTKVEIAPSQLDHLAVVRSIEVSQYRWRDMTDPDDMFTAPPKPNAPTVQAGLIAQQVHSVFSDGAVPGGQAMGAERLWSLDNNNLIALLIGAVQTLTERIEVLEGALAGTTK